MGNTKTITDQNFESEILKSPLPALLDFWAEWCGPCRMLAPVLDRLALENEGKIVVGKMNVDENPQTPQKFGIQGIPTLIVFKGGAEVHRIVGFQSQEAIQRALNDIAG